MFADYDSCVADADAEYRHDIHGLDVLTGIPRLAHIMPLLFNQLHASLKTFLLFVP
jgi:hypothetical protein